MLFVNSERGMLQKKQDWNLNATVGRKIQQRSTNSVAQQLCCSVMKTLQSRDDNRAEILHDGSVCVGLCEDYKEGERSCCPVCLKQLIAKRYQTTKVHLQLPGGAQPWFVPCRGQPGFWLSAGRWKRQQDQPTLKRTRRCSVVSIHSIWIFILILVSVSLYTNRSWPQNASG